MEENNMEIVMTFNEAKKKKNKFFETSWIMNF